MADDRPTTRRPRWLLWLAVFFIAVVVARWAITTVSHVLDLAVTLGVVGMVVVVLGRRR